MGNGDHCAVWGCDNDRRYPEKQKILPHVGVLRFYSPQNQTDVVKWDKLISRKHFKVTKNTKVCSNHFKLGYRCRASCPYPTLHMKGYKDQESEQNKRAPPRDRVVSNHCKQKRLMKRKREEKNDDECLERKTLNLDETEASEFVKNCESPSSSVDVDIVEDENDRYVSHSDSVNGMTFDDKSIDNLTCEENDAADVNPILIKRAMFVDQATCDKNCCRYTGLTREKLLLVFGFVKEKAKTIRYWRGSVDTCQAQRRKRNCSRALSSWEEYVLTLVRTRKGFDVRFLADTFGISHGQVSRTYNTWVTFLSLELSFLVPWPTQAEISAKLPKRFAKFSNVRVIVDCMELYIQKAHLPSGQKISWSSYKHSNTAKVLVGITPCGVISFVSALWSGTISDKEIFRRSGIIQMLQEGDGVMADRGFLVRDLLVTKKVHLICPAYCKGPRLSVKGVTYSRRVAALRSHVERYILKLKLFRILSGVIPLSMKSMLDPIVKLCAALANLGKKSIK